MLGGSVHLCKAKDGGEAGFVRAADAVAGRRRRLPVSIAVVLVAGLCFVRFAAAAEDATPAAATAAVTSPIDATKQEIAERRAALATELAAARGQLEAAAGAATSAEEHTLFFLEKLDGLYQRQIAALEDAADQSTAREQVEAALSVHQASDLAAQPPPSVLELDRAREDLEAEINRSRTDEGSVQAATEALQQAKERAADRESARREAREALETNEDPAATAGLETALRLRQLESRVAAEEVRAHELELNSQRLARDARRARTMLLGARVQQLAGTVQLGRAALQDQLVQLDKREDELTQVLTVAKLELTEAERLWAQTKHRAATSLEPDTALSEEVDARRLAQQTRQFAVTVLTERLQRVNDRKQAWNRRFQVAAGSVPRDELSRWAREARQEFEQLEREERVQRARRDELQDERTKRGEAAAAAGPGEMSRWMREQQRQLDQRIQLYGAALASLDEARRVHRNLLYDLEARLATTTWRERAGAVWEGLRTIWRYEIATVDDRPITVAKIVVGLVFFGVGLLLAGYVSRQLGGRVFPRLGFEAGAAAALQSISFYVFLLFLALFALRVINVPLTAFTLLGGAVAIGIGFGSQNIVNNFISGLILFAERPVRVGDLIEVDGTYGTVERIGARSTRVRSSSNIHIVVPNSAFLEKNVVNWTLSDDQVRTHVAVGVAYGSPTREVTRLLRKAVDEHERVLPRPEPVVLFTDFGDNALVFEVHFWIRMRSSMERRIVESDVRYRIDQLLRHAGITIAFPQRDVHLDSLKPVEVRLVTDAAAEHVEPAAAVAARGKA